MNYIPTNIEGVCLIEPRVFTDSRGHFVEAFKRVDFGQHIGAIDFIQEHESSEKDLKAVWLRNAEGYE